MNHMPILMLGLVCAVSSVALTSDGYPQFGVPIGIIGLVFVVLAVAATWFEDRSAKARAWAAVQQHTDD